MSKSNPKRTGAAGEGADARTPAQRLQAAAGRLGQLTAKQQRAIGLICGGCALLDVAKRVEVCRGTVYNWTRRNPRFMAALESWQQDMARATRARLMGLSAAGLKAILRSLEAGDGKVALAMFKGLGILATDGRREATDDDEPPRVVLRRCAATERDG